MRPGTYEIGVPPIPHMAPPRQPLRTDFPFLVFPLDTLPCTPSSFLFPSYTTTVSMLPCRCHRHPQHIQQVLAWMPQGRRVRIEPEELVLPLPPPHCLGPFSVRGIKDSDTQSSKDKNKGVKVTDVSSAFAGAERFGQSKKASNSDAGADTAENGAAVSSALVVDRQIWGGLHREEFLPRAGGLGLLVWRCGMRPDRMPDDRVAWHRPDRYMVADFAGG